MPCVTHFCSWHIILHQSIPITPAIPYRRNNKKGVPMPETTCKEAAISDAYFDYIFSPEYPLRFGYNGGYCIQPIAPAFTSAYVSAQEMPSYSIENAHYTFVPKLYGLMEGTVSDSVRTISLQQDSYLGLTGEGILLGIIGTGINYQSCRMIRRQFLPAVFRSGLSGPICLQCV